MLKEIKFTKADRLDKTEMVIALCMTGVTTLALFGIIGMVMTF